MTTTEILDLIESVNRRRNDGTVSPVHTPDAHFELLEDFNKLIDAGYRIGANDEWHKI
jgi:hypothetical protein